MLNFNLLDTVQIFYHPEPIELFPAEPEPATPETLDDLIGVEIVFRHENRYLYPDSYAGTVTDYRYCQSRSNPTGWLELKVKSPSFNIQKWVHEENFVCYLWEATVTASAATIAS